MCKVTTKIFKTLLIFVFSFMFEMSITSAIQITEVMYDPSGTDTGREWVELYNDTGAPIPLTTFKLFESNVNHGITSTRGANVIDAGEYVVLVDDTNKFLIDNPSYLGKVFDSSFSLSNSGEALAVKDATSNVIANLTYNTALGAAGNGNTLCDISGTWSECMATPGQSNVAVTISNNNSTTTTTATTTTSETSTTTDNTSTTTSAASNSSSFSIPDSTNYRYGNLDIKALKDRSVIAGGEYVYSAKAFNYKGTPLSAVQYFFSFGDGGGREGNDVKYIYGYPGEYDLNIEGSNSDGEGTTVMHVYVSRPDLEISEIGISEPYIKILNKTSRDLDLSNYIIDNRNGYFKIAKNTKIKANNTLTLSGYAMGFGTTTEARLLFPNMKEVIGFSKNKFTSTSEAVVASGATSSYKQTLLQNFEITENVKSNQATNPASFIGKTNNSDINKVTLNTTSDKALVKYVYKDTKKNPLEVNASIDQNTKQAVPTKGVATVQSVAEAATISQDKSISGEKSLAERFKIWLYK